MRPDDRRPPVNNNILLVHDDPRPIQILARILAESGDLRFASAQPASISMYGNPEADEKSM